MGRFPLALALLAFLPPLPSRVAAGENEAKQLFEQMRRIMSEAKALEMHVTSEFAGKAGDEEGRGSLSSSVYLVHTFPGFRVVFACKCHPASDLRRFVNCNM